MCKRVRVLALAAASALLLPSAAALADNAISSQSFTMDAAPSPDAPTANDRPLMYLLKEGNTGFGKWFVDNGFFIQGHLEGSFTDDTRSVPNKFIGFPQVFDVYQRKVNLNQADIAIGRNQATDKFDVGGMVEMIYGTDSRFIHSDGLMDNHNNDVSPPFNQWDLTQAYLTANIPVGNGITLEAGKFTTLLGYETISPFLWGGTANTSSPSLPEDRPSLYSHSYMFGYAIPFTQTGAMASYSIGDATKDGSWKFTAGFSRGWGQTFKDNNGSIDGFGEVAWSLNDWGEILNVSFGPQNTADDSHWKTVLDGILTYHPSAIPALALAANSDWGYDSGQAPNGSAAYYYGVALYGSYDITDWLSANARVEWFRDANGDPNVTGIKTNYYEATLGLAMSPVVFATQPGDLQNWLRNVVIRPEVRIDHSNARAYNGVKDETTLSLEMLVRL